VILLALGSNLGQREQLLVQAREGLAHKGVLVSRQSSVVETPALVPVGAPASWDRPYLNQVIEVKTELDPVQLLLITQAVEAELGRQPAARWAPRPIDIDILACGATVMQGDRLTLPHPQLHLRRFVLEPLCELAPQWVHPLLRASASELLLRLAA
jgi:2-amino-4-hydroxy-6-hydroxymethyldihydropteridine diphosphokinase